MDAVTIVISVTAMVVAIVAVRLIVSFRRALSLTNPATLRAVAAGRVVPKPGGDSAAGPFRANPVTDYRRAADVGSDAGVSPDSGTRLPTRSTR